MCYAESLAVNFIFHVKRYSMEICIFAQNNNIQQLQSIFSISNETCSDKGHSAFAVHLRVPVSRARHRRDEPLARAWAACAGGCGGGGLLRNRAVEKPGC